MNRQRRWFSVALVAVLALSIATCDILKVESPGRIADEDLAAIEAFPALVVGMAFDLTQALDNANQDIALASGELFHGGSYDFADLPRGIILDEDVNGEWASAQQARWVAEDGIKRMQEILEPDQFAKSPLVARAYLLGGFANRLLGEMLCSTAIDGGEEQPHTVHFTRALNQFTEAISVGGAAGTSDIVSAAYGGRASMKAWTGDWSGAATDGNQVEIDFRYDSPYTNEVANDIQYETYARPEFSVFGTEFEDYPDDVRAPWSILLEADGSVSKGANGTTPMYQQEKYPLLSSAVPLTKGTEMRVLAAEAELRGGNIGPAFVLLNEARDEWGMVALAVPATLTEAWTTLHHERGAEVWLETRRLWDLRRWFAESGDAHHDFLQGRDTCFPISEDEKASNPNLSG
jgi:hypothetical protein